MSDICVLPLTGKPEQQWFRMQSHVQTSISSRQHSAIRDCPSLEWLGLGPTVRSLPGFMDVMVFCSCQIRQSIRYSKHSESQLLTNMSLRYWRGLSPGLYSYLFIFICLFTF